MDPYVRLCERAESRLITVAHPTRLGNDTPDYCSTANWFWVVDEATSPDARVTSGTRGLVHYYVDTES